MQKSVYDMDEHELLEQQRKMKTFLTQFRETTSLYRQLKPRTHARIDAVLGMDPIPKELIALYMVHEDHCEKTKRDPFSNEAMYLFMHFPG